MIYFIHIHMTYSCPTDGDVQGCRFMRSFYFFIFFTNHAFPSNTCMAVQWNYIYNIFKKYVQNQEVLHKKHLKCLFFVFLFFLHKICICKIIFFVDNTTIFHTKCENTVKKNYQNNLCMINPDARKKMTHKILYLKTCILFNNLFSQNGYKEVLQYTGHVL